MSYQTVGYAIGALIVVVGIVYIVVLLALDQIRRHQRRHARRRPGYIDLRPRHR